MWTEPPPTDWSRRTVSPTSKAAGILEATPWMNLETGTTTSRANCARGSNCARLPWCAPSAAAPVFRAPRQPAGPGYIPCVNGGAACCSIHSAPLLAGARRLPYQPTRALCHPFCMPCRCSVDNARVHVPGVVQRRAERRTFALNGQNAPCASGTEHWAKRSRPDKAGPEEAGSTSSLECA